MNALSKKVICRKCKKRMKFKKESGGKYCCSTYDNYGKEHCDRVIVKEEFIRGLIERRFQKEMSDQEIKEIVDYVIVENSLLIEIHFNNGDVPILLQGKFMQY